MELLIILNNVMIIISQIMIDVLNFVSKKHVETLYYKAPNNVMTETQVTEIDVQKSVLKKFAEIVLSIMVKYVTTAI